MNDELQNLYQEIIIDHNKTPRNFKKIDPNNHHADGHNPLCGDRLTVELFIEGDRIVNIGFTGSGCAISTASASLMTEAVKGKTLAEAEKLFNGFHALVTSETEDNEELGKLRVFSGVREFPSRVKCAILCWHTLQAAIKNENAPVSTEN